MCAKYKYIMCREVIKLQCKYLKLLNNNLSLYKIQYISVNFKNRKNKKKPETEMLWTCTVKDAEVGTDRQGGQEEEQCVDIVKEVYEVSWCERTGCRGWG